MVTKKYLLRPTESLFLKVMKYVHVPYPLANLPPPQKCHAESRQVTHIVE